MVHFCHTLLKGIITEVHCKDRGKLQLCCHPVTTHWFTDDGVSPVLGRLTATKPCISLTGSLCLLLCCLLLLWLVVGVGWCGGAHRAPEQSLLHSWLGKIHGMPQYTTGLDPPPAWRPGFHGFTSSIWILILKHILPWRLSNGKLDEIYFVVTLVADKMFDNLIQCVNPFNDTVQYWNLFTEGMCQWNPEHKVIIVPKWKTYFAVYLKHLSVHVLYFWREVAGTTVMLIFNWPHFSVSPNCCHEKGVPFTHKNIFNE